MGPMARDHCAMPTKQGLRGDEERRPAPPGQQQVCGSQKGAIGRPESRPRDLATQDRELVTEYDDLELLVFGRAETERASSINLRSARYINDIGKGALLGSTVAA